LLIDSKIVASTDYPEKEIFDILSFLQVGEDVNLTGFEDLNLLRILTKRVFRLLYDFILKRQFDIYIIPLF